jgi:hypothetical protein
MDANGIDKRSVPFFSDSVGRHIQGIAPIHAIGCMVYGEREYSDDGCTERVKETTFFALSFPWFRLVFK